MKLTDIVTSLELAKKLKELGFPQESLFYWVSEFDRHKMVETGVWVVTQGLEGINTKMREYYSAPTAEELLEWLPSGVFIAKGKKYRTWFDKTDVNPFEWEQSFEFDPIDNDRLVDGLAKMVIYLSKNKIIKLKIK